MSEFQSVCLSLSKSSTSAAQGSEECAVNIHFQIPLNSPEPQTSTGFSQRGANVTGQVEEDDQRQEAVAYNYKLPAW